MAMSFNRNKTTSKVVGGKSIPTEVMSSKGSPFSIFVGKHHCFHLFKGLGLGLGLAGWLLASPASPASTWWQWSVAQVLRGRILGWFGADSGSAYPGGCWVGFGLTFGWVWVGMELTYQQSEATLEPLLNQPHTQHKSAPANSNHPKPTQQQPGYQPLPSLNEPQTNPRPALIRISGSLKLALNQPEQLSTATKSDVMATPGPSEAGRTTRPSHKAKPLLVTFLGP